MQRLFTLQNRLKKSIVFKFLPIFNTTVVLIVWCWMLCVFFILLFLLRELVGEGFSLGLGYKVEYNKFFLRIEI